MTSITVVDALHATKARSALLERAFHAAAPVLVPLFGESALRTALAVELDRDLKACGTEQTVSTFSHRRVDAARLLQLDDAPGRWIVAELRRQRETHPSAHVLVKHRSFAIESRTDIVRLIDGLRSVFADEPIDGVSVTRYESNVEPIPPEGRLETRYVAAPVGELHLPDGRSTPPKLDIRPPESMTFYDAYEGWYHEFWRQRPELVAQVPIETRDDLERCMGDDGLRLLYIDGALCGVMAAIRQVEFGLKGWRMREKVIAPEFWGRGLAAPATVGFARSLNSEPGDALWGTIVPDNLTSMRSAQAVGRRTIGSQYRLT